MIYFALPGNEELVTSILAHAGGQRGVVEYRSFPDDETYLRVLTDVEGKNVGLVCTLDHPDGKLLPLFFLAETVRQLGASRVELIVPYLAYMRQDRRFKPGEAVTSDLFAALISRFADALITVDPHLHRHSKLSEIYTIPTRVAHAAPALAKWIAENVSDPLVIGPDAESRQWVSEVAGSIGAPYIVLDKVRTGDREVRISFPSLDLYQGKTPVLVDDIVSTARTLITAVRQLKDYSLKAPVCVAVHGLFAGNSYQELREAGASQIVTTNSVRHVSNAIDIVPLLMDPA